MGAGPYGMTTAAYARRRGLEPVVVGEPRGFWKHHMPPGMLLRSGVDRHLDAAVSERSRREHGVAEVHVVYRHDTPRFAAPTGRSSIR